MAKTIRVSSASDANHVRRCQTMAFHLRRGLACPKPGSSTPAAPPRDRQGRQGRARPPASTARRRHVLRAIAERNDLDTATVDDVIWGTSNQSNTQGGDLGRMAALDAGYDVRASGVTLDRFCGSGITSSNLAAGMIMSGLEDVIVAGGTELMSSYRGQPPPRRRTVHRRRQRPPARHPPAAAPGHLRRCDRHAGGDSRLALDELAVESQRRAATAIAEGRFDRSLVPVVDDDGTVLLDREEFPRPDTTLERLQALAPAFAAFYDSRSTSREPRTSSCITAEFPDLEIEHVHHAGQQLGCRRRCRGHPLRQPATPPRRSGGSRGLASSPPPTSVTTPR